MFEFRKRDGTTVQCHKECHIKLSREEFEEKYNRSIIYYGSSGYTQMNVYTRDEDAPIDAECYVKQLGDDPIQGYEIVVRNDKFIKETRLWIKEENSLIIQEKNTVGFRTVFFTKNVCGGRGAYNEIFTLRYTYDNGIWVQTPELLGIYHQTNGNLLLEPSEFIKDNRTTITRFTPDNIQLSVEDHDYVSYKKVVPIDKLYKFELKVDVKVDSFLTPTNISSEYYSRSYEIDLRRDSYVEKIFVGDKQVLQIETDKKEEKYFKIFRNRDGQMVPQIEIKLYYDNEFCFAVKIRDEQYRNINIGELRELYNTLQFMADIRASAKDCDGSKKYEDLSFFCRSFFSLYPTLLTGKSLGNKNLADDMEITHKTFPELHKIGIFYGIEDCEDLQEIKKALFYYEDDKSDFKIVRLENIKHTHSVLGIIPRDDCKKILIFDPSYLTTSSISPISESMKALLLEPTATYRRTVAFYSDIENLKEQDMSPAFEGAVFLNTFPIQQNGTCWAWSMAAGLAALEYNTYDDIVRAASTMVRLGIDKFTEKATEKLKGITDYKLAIMPEDKILKLSGLGSEKEYVIPDPYEVAMKRFGVKLQRERNDSQQYIDVEKPVVLATQYMSDSTMVSHYPRSALASALEVVTKVPTQPIKEEESRDIQPTVDAQKKDGSLIPQNKWITLYHQQAGKEEENSIVR